MRKYLVIIMSAILIIYIVYTNIKPKIWEYNANKFKESVNHIENNDIINLNDITPFEWDTVYFFSPYTDDDYIYDTIGYRFDKIKFNYDESANQAIFLNDKKVICYLNGYSHNVGYYFQLNKYSDSMSEAHLKLSNNQTNNFKITHDNNIINISHIYNKN